MQPWGRKSLWLALSASWLLLILLGVCPLLRLAAPPKPLPGPPRGWPRWLDAAFLRSFSQAEPLLERVPQPPPASLGSSCTWRTCFDASKCQGDGLKIFLHPTGGPASEEHRRILASLGASGHYTASPGEACLLLLLTLPTPGHAQACDPLPPRWNSSRNLLVLSLQPAPCTWAGQAMVAEASPSVDTFRPGFDVALPLLPKAYPWRGGAPGQLQQHTPQPGATLLAIAETRGGWRPAGTHASACPWDCEQDPEPQQTHRRPLQPNATFCLIPGHRPAAPHFLQALQAGCIPVLLSPRWELPFSEVIDWTQAAIIADERLSLQVLAALQEMPPARVLALRQQTQFLWGAYFSSVEKVLQTTLQIIQDRIWGPSAHSWMLWNRPPGALLALPTFSTNPQDFPFYHLQQGSSEEGRFSALIWMGVPGEPPLKLIQAVSGSQHCAQIVVLWGNEDPPPSRWPEVAVPVTVIEGCRKATDRFFPYSTISTNAILSLDAHSSLSTSEVDFAFTVWQSFPERMVGFLTCHHFWNESRAGWGYSAEMANEFSMVLTTAAFYHRYYHSLFTHALPKTLRSLADEGPACVDILMNFLVAAVTKSPPIKVPYAQQQHPQAQAPGGSGPGPEPQPLAQDCINQLVAEFGHMPLVSSRLRLDPVLFKDPVSAQRKKYRSLEKP